MEAPVMMFKLERGTMGTILALGGGLFGVALMGLGQTGPDGPMGFWVSAAGCAVLTGCIVYGLAKFALWCEHDTTQRAPRQTVDVLKFRRDELLQRDARKDSKQ